MAEHRRKSLVWLWLMAFMAFLAMSVLAASNQNYSKVWERDFESGARFDKSPSLNTSEAVRTDYNGNLRIFVVEPVGRWLDNGEVIPHADPKPFGNTVIGYAYNEDIFVNESMDLDFVWDADAAGFGDITNDNIKIVAVLYNSEAHQAYSDPPAGNPYYAHYVDATVQAYPGETNSNNVSTTYTHTVFLEESAATW